MAVGFTPVISLVWYVYWSLDNYYTEALHLLYASYVLLLLLYILQQAAKAAVTDWDDSGLDSGVEGK